MFARNLSDKGDMRPGPAHLVGPHLARGPARLLPALTTSMKRNPFQNSKRKTALVHSEQALLAIWILQNNDRNYKRTTTLAYGGRILRAR
jgi:hypothetical protein